jgi:hypothetical protein
VELNLDVWPLLFWRRRPRIGFEHYSSHLSHGPFPPLRSVSPLGAIPATKQGP